MKIIGQIQPSLLYFLVALSTLTETIYSAALPQIANQLNTEANIVQLSSTTYCGGFALGILTLGRVSDIYGRRPVILFGMLVYIFSTFLISLSTNIEFFLVMRIFQAYGASVGSGIAQSMARDSYKGWELSYMYSVVSIVMSVVPAIGSTIGGYVIEYYQDWQYVFYSLVFFSTCLFFVYLKFLPETNPYIGVAKEYKFLMVLKTALRDRNLLGYAYMVGAYNGIRIGFYIQAPFILIEHFKMHAASYGKLFMILTAANLFGGFLCQYLIKRYINSHKLISIGLVVSSVAAIMFLLSSYFISDNTPIYSVAMMVFLPISVHIIGHSFAVPMLLRNALEDYKKVTGSAGSIFGFLYYVVTAIVSLMVSIFYTNQINNYAYLFTILIASCVAVFRANSRYNSSRMNLLSN